MYIWKGADGGYVDERVGTLIDTLKEMSKDLSENLTKFSPNITWKRKKSYKYHGNTHEEKLNFLKNLNAMFEVLGFRQKHAYKHTHTHAENIRHKKETHPQWPKAAPLSPGYFLLKMKEKAKTKWICWMDKNS